MEALQNLDYPSEKENWAIDILIGGLITMVPIFNFVAMGYMMEAMEMGIRGLPKIPDWSDLSGKFLKGLLFFVITLVYVMIPLLCLLIFLVPLIIELSTRGEASVITGVIAGLGILVYMLLLFAAGFLMPMALARWVDRGSISEAFRLGAVLEQIKAVLADYLVAYLLMVFLGMVVLLVASWIPVVNMMVYFYWSVAFYNYFGKLYARTQSKSILTSAL